MAIPIELKSPRKKLRTLVPYVGLTLAGLAFAAWLILDSRPPAAVERRNGITELVPALELPHFSLSGGGATPITRETLRGHWTLLSIGFTSCPDICPNTLGLLAQSVTQSTPQTSTLQTLFVSVDPDRDQPKQVEAYAKHFGEFTFGATGSHQRLLELTKPLGLFYQRDPAGADPSRYNVQHSTTVLLVSPEAKVTALLRPSEFSAAELATELNRLRERA